MVLRRIVTLIGILIGLAGLTEILFPVWTINMAIRLYSSVPLRIAGVIGLAMGVVLVIAAIKKQVGLRGFVLVLGGIFMLFSVVAVAEPGLVRDLGFALVIRRSWGFQLAILWITGLIRFAIGGTLLYAATKAAHSAS